MLTIVNSLYFSKRDEVPLLVIIKTGKAPLTKKYYMMHCLAKNKFSPEDNVKLWLDSGSVPAWTGADITSLISAVINIVKMSGWGWKDQEIWAWV